MNEPSMSQKEFVFKEKLHKSQVQICRVMLLAGSVGIVRGTGHH